MVKESEMKKRLLVQMPRSIELLRSLHPKMFLSMDSTIRRYKNAVMKDCSLKNDCDAQSDTRKGSDEGCS